MSLKNFLIALLVLILLWWSFQGLDLKALSHQLQYIDYRWLLPIFICTCIGHSARAYRWKLALSHLPQAPQIPTKDTFAAIWVAYLVNYATPRLGEATRTGVIAKKYKLPFSAVLGTVIADRLWDMLVSLLGFVSLIFVAREAYQIGYQRILKPLQENLILFWLTCLIIGVAIGILYYFRNKIAAFLQGIQSSFDWQQKEITTVLSAIIWLCYTLNTLMGFYLCNTFGIWSLTDAWVLLMIAALSTLIPTPGGFGSYHAFMIWALTTIWGIGRSDAATYALVNHAIQLCFSMFMGAWGFWHFRKIQ